MKARNKIGKTVANILAFLIVLCTVFYIPKYDAQAEISIGGDVSVTINPVKYSFLVNYVDNAGNVIGTPYVESNRTYEAGETKTFSPPVADIEEYTYLGYNYELLASGRKVGFVDGDNPTIIIDIVTEDVDIGKCTFCIDMVYTKNDSLDFGGELEIPINPIQYTYNVNYVNPEGDAIIEPTVGSSEYTGSSFSQNVETIEGYTYAGHYYRNESGEEGVNIGGSITELLYSTEQTITITTNSEGKDAVSGSGLYSLYLVYTPDYVETETESPDNLSEIETEIETAAETETAEETETETVAVPGAGTNTSPKIAMSTCKNTRTNSNVPKTGDMTSINFVILLLAVSMTILIVSVISIKINRHKNNKNNNN